MARGRRAWAFSLVLGWISTGCSIPAQEISESPRGTGTVSDVGQYGSFLERYARKRGRSLSYLARDWEDLDRWRTAGRAKMHELLTYEPAPAAARAKTLRVVQKNGYKRHHVRYSISEGRSTEAFLLIPDGLTKPAPSIVAIHDHGGFYYFGKRKITETEDAPKVLRDFIESYYGGRTLADELARRGFVVLVPDGFYFGSQRLDPSRVDPDFTGKLKDLTPGSDEYIRAFNRFAGAHENITAKTIFDAGTTWPGILFHGDRASVDYLVTRPEVDAMRIGCVGLSIGGFRSAHLAGLDSRIRVGVVAGWMATYDSLLARHLRHHTWMCYVPGQLDYLDLPDVVSLNAPRPLMVINCSKDTLFPLEGMRAAESKLAKIYAKMDASERFQCRYYDVPHSLDVRMQDDAIDWLEKWLK